MAAADIILAPQPVVAKVEEVEVAVMETTKVDPVVVESVEETTDVEAEANLEEQVAVVVADTVVVPEIAAAVEAEADIATDIQEAKADVDEPKVDVTDGSKIEEQKILAAEQPTPVLEEAKTEVAILKSDESGVEVISRSSAPELMS
ncbi:hypothetical protein KWD35_15665, partial [Listeria monocytogenes]|uniref:hypothetical protein n=1 Tax=Listeria monocytogenes TaxID=1639 RepID=UPI001C479533